MAATVASAPIRVGNADNQVTLQSGASAPELLQLARTGSAAWQGMAVTSLIGHATIGGREMPLHWRFDPASSHHGEHAASLV
ncbi:MAG: hypothetical protein M3Y93_08685, partial [Pseudomonadota bacterium]|nr:hypothetical protein [Pseudomonadota bacterium]